jgi:hypothetical protein
MAEPIETAKWDTAQIVEMMGEIDGVYDTLATYNEALAAYVFDPVNNPLPDFAWDTVSIDQLLSVAQATKEAAVDLTSGAITSIVYKAESVAREVGTRLNTKAMLYDKAVSDAGIASREGYGEAGRTVSNLRGTSTEQIEGL